LNLELRRSVPGTVESVFVHIISIVS
jgi:hypothetical protein